MAPRPADLGVTLALETRGDFVFGRHRDPCTRRFATDGEDVLRGVLCVCVAGAPHGSEEYDEEGKKKKNRRPTVVFCFRFFGSALSTGDPNLYPYN